MSNIRLSRITPDVVSSTPNVVSLPGELSVDSISILSTADAVSSSSASAIINGGVSISKSLLIGQAIKFSSTSASLLSDTLLGSDTKSLTLSAGGSVDRGASIEMYGNQHANTGSMKVHVGTGGTFSLFSDSTESFRVDSSGIVRIFSSNTSSLIINGGISITSTNDATSISGGGTLTLAGGMSVSKSVYVGSLNSAGIISISSTTDSIGIASGSLTVLGGTSISKALYVGGSLNAISSVNIDGILTSTNTSDSAVGINGGMVVSKGLTIGGLLTCLANVSTSGIISSTNTTESSQVTNGSLVTSGGVGISKSIRVGGDIYGAGSFTLSNSSGILSTAGKMTVVETTDSSSLSVASVVLSGGISVTKNIRVGANAFVTGTFSVTGSSTAASLTTSGVVTFNSTSTTSSPTVASLIIKGGVGIGGTVYTNGQIFSNNTTESSSLSTGSIVTNGGISASKSVRVGIDLFVTGSSSLSSANLSSTLSVAGVLTNTNVLDSSTTSDGSAVFSGGIGVAKNMNIGANLSVTGNSIFTGNQSVSGLLSVTNTVESTSMSLASVKISGGVSITKSLRVGLDTFITGNANISGVVSVLNTTPSTSSTSGSLVIAGGLGVGHSLFVSNSLNVSGTTSLASNTTVFGIATFSNTTDSNSPTVGSVVVLGGLGVSKNVNIAETITVSGNAYLLGSNTISGITLITNTTDSSAYNSGSLVVSGGLGVSGKINCNSNLTVTGPASFVNTVNFTNVTDSNSSITGAAVFSGGMGILRNLNVGGALSVGSSISAAGSVSISSGSLLLNTITITDTSGNLIIQSPVPTLRIAGTNAIKNTQYTNSLDLFTLGNSYADSNHEALQITNTSTTTYTIMARNAGAGGQRKIVIQSGATNTGQLTLNTNGSLSLGFGTTDSTSLVTGTVLISGGTAVNGSLSIKNKIQMFGSTSGMLSLVAPVTVTPYSLILPSTLPVANNYALVSSTTGTLSWAQMTTSDPSFVTVLITSTTDSTSVSTGALIVNGGVGISGMINCGEIRTLSPIQSRRVAGYGATLPKTPHFILGQDDNDKNLNITSGFAMQYESVGNQITHGTLTLSAIRSTAYNSSSAFAYSSGDFYDLLSISGLGIFSITNTTETSSLTNGAFIVSGGLVSKKSVSIGANLQIFGSTSGNVNIKSPDTVNSYNLILPSDLPVENNFALVCTNITTGALSWSEMTTANPIFTSVIITDTTAALGSNTGALQVAGGVDIKNNLVVSGVIDLNGDTSGKSTLKASAVSSNPVFTLPPDLPTTSGKVLLSDSDGNLSFGDMTSTTEFTFTGANNVSSATAVSNLKFAQMFSIDVQVQLVTSVTTLTAMYTLKGYPSNSNYTLFTKYLGDDLGVTFSIDSSGQLYYTSLNTPNFTGLTFKWTGPDIYNVANGASPQSAAGLNNQTTPVNVNGLLISDVQFSKYVLVTITASTNLNSLYLLQGVQQANGSWIISQQITGSDAQIEFSMLNTGQVQYTSTNLPGWTNTNFQFYSPVVSLQSKGSFNGLQSSVYYSRNGIFNLTSTYTTLFTLDDLESGILQIITTTPAGATFATINLMYTSTGGVADATVSMGSNVLVQINGGNVQLKSVNNGTFAMTYSYIRLI